MENTAKNYKGEAMIQFPENAEAKFYTFRSKPYYDEDGENFKVAHGIEVRFNDGDEWIEKFYSDDNNFFAKHQDEGIEVIDTAEMKNPNAVINAFWMDEYMPTATIYKREQQYGGAEEGGWYYHTEKAIGILPMEDVEKFEKEIEESDFRSYETHEVVHVGFFYGQHENVRSQIYC